MSNPKVFPDFDDRWILHLSDDLVVVDKPPGVPTQAPSPDEPDDLVVRLGRYLDERGLGAYLGVHQRLDRDTSGVMVLTRRKEANAELSRLFEGRGVEKAYVALARAGLGKRTLSDELDKGEGGTMIVVGRGRGKLAVTHVNEKQGAAGRARYDLRLETGRTHQARAQLAHARAPIAGDRLYAGPLAPRLMLHAATLVLPLPGAAPLRFSAPLPRAFERWLRRGHMGRAVYDDGEALADALEVAKNLRFSLGRSESTTCFRLVNEGGDALPHLAVDVYGEHAVVQLYDDGEGLWEERSRVDRVLDAVSQMGFAGVYLKNRPRQANVLVDTRRDELAPKVASRGADAADPLVVLEEGVPFAVRLGDGLSTGIFLDQRRNRRLLRVTAEGARVLNLFSYTCGFSIAAALGGAKETVSVDASLAALERGREGLRLASAPPEGQHKLVGDDAFSYLERAKKRGDVFDVVVLDPPSYSTSKKRRFVAEQHYGELAEKALSVLAPGGRLFASTNHRGISRAKLRRMLFAAAEAAARPVAQIKDLPHGSDHPPEPGAEPNMKAMLVTLARPGEAVKTAPPKSPKIIGNRARGGRPEKKRRPV